MADEPVVRCADCLTMLAEPPNTPLERRIPCPECGSKARSYAIALTAALMMQPDMAQPGMAQPEIASEARVVSAEASLADAGLSLEWLRLSSGGAWMVRVYDRDGEFIDGSIQDDPQDAILAVSERLLPPSDQAH